MVKRKRKKAKKNNKPVRQQQTGNRKAFDQLLDDAIFGAPSKRPKGAP